MDQLPCSTIVYRTITKSKHIGNDGRPNAFEFHRRPPHPQTGEPRDVKGLSVNYDVQVPDGCAPGHTGKKLIVSLHVGRIRDTHSDLNVRPDSVTHANIVGIPRQEENAEKLEQFAAALVAISRKAWP